MNAKSMFRRLFRSPTAKIRNTPARTRLGVQELEERRNPGGSQIGLDPTAPPPSGIVYSAGEVAIIGTGVADVATAKYDSTGTKLVVSLNSQTATFDLSKVSRVSFTGYGGNDQFTNSTSVWSIALGGDGEDTLTGGNGGNKLVGGAQNDTLMGGYGSDTLEGNGGDDSLYGLGGNDFLYGGENNDTLYGGANNDKLYGGANDDKLYGEGDNDWLDAGSAIEVADGGVGWDFNAYVTTIDGAKYTDIVQGGAPNCWILASIGSLANKNIDLSQRITYTGNDVYAVRLYNFIDATHPEYGMKTWTEYVTFNGSARGCDPTQGVGADGESWVIIMNRAVIQAVSRWDPSQNLDTPHSGGAGHALAILTGTVGTSVSPSGFSSAEALGAQLAAGKLVVAHTKNEGVTSLIATHAYTVLSAGCGYVTLWNPHGSYVTVSWDVFLKDVSTLAIN